jgi:hypothetical protein
MYKNSCIRFFEEEGVKYTEPKENIIKVIYSSDNMNGIPILALFDDDGDNLVEFKCFDIINLSNKKDEAIVLCNNINSKYRWVRFHIDEDGDVICGADTYVFDGSCGIVCKNMLERMANIIDDVYPSFARLKFS